MRFSEALQELLDHRATDPDDCNGFTDKAWFRERKRLEDQLDSFFETDKTA